MDDQQETPLENGPENDPSPPEQGSNSQPPLDEGTESAATLPDENQETAPAAGGTGNGAAGGGPRAKEFSAKIETKAAEIVNGLGIKSLNALIMIASSRDDAGAPPGSSNKRGAGQPGDAVQTTEGGQDRTPAPAVEAELEKNERLKTLLRMGVVRAAIDANALIVTDGRDAGTAKLVGLGVKALTREACQINLLGVASQDAQPELNPNHTRLERVESADREQETTVRYQLAEEWENPSALTGGTRIPVVTVLAGGGNVAKLEVLRSVHNGWPVLVLGGSKGLADQIADWWRKKGEQGGTLTPEQRTELEKDGVLTEVVDEGDIYIFAENEPPPELQPMLARLLPVWEGDETLRKAWFRFAMYDHRAIHYQDVFEKMRMWILRLGVIGTFLVLFRATLKMLVEQEVLPGGETILGAAFTALAEVTKGVLGTAPLEVAATAAEQEWPAFGLVDGILGYVVLLLPIVTTLLITAANQFTPGGKWLLFRASAEAIKREIYTYRVRTGRYGKRETVNRGTTPEAELAAQVESISRNLMKTEANMGVVGKFRVFTDEELSEEKQSKDRIKEIKTLKDGLRTFSAAERKDRKASIKALQRQEADYQKRKKETAKKSDKGIGALQIPPEMWFAAGDDDGLSRLTPDDYVRVRLGDQISYYSGKAVRLEKEFKRYQWLIFGVAAMGTLLAAVGLDLWIALTTALTAAMITFLDYKQTEPTLIRYNQAGTDMNNVREWWNSLMPTEKRDPENIRRLVSVTERLLRTEQSGWIQEMQDALTELREGPEASAAQGAQPSGSSPQ